MSATVPPVRQLLLPLLPLLVWGCSNKALPLLHTSSQPRLNFPKTAAPLATAPGSMTAREVVPTVEGSHGPYLATHPDHALLLLVAPGPGGLLWKTQALDERNTPAPPRELGPAPADVTLLSLRPGHQGGFALAWSRRVPGGHVIEAQDLGPDGAPRGGVIQVHQGAEPPAWLDVAPSATGLRVFFTTLAAGGGRIHGAEIAGGATQGVQVLLDQAASWQIAAASRGTLLLAVLGDGYGPAAGRPVAIPVLDGARPGSLSPLQQEPILGSELEALVVGDRVFVGWDDRGLDLKVKIAALAPDGKLLTPPTAALPSIGDQGLVHLAPGCDGGLLVAWDDLSLPRAPSNRWIRLSSLDARLSPGGPQAALRHDADDGFPLLQPSPDGFAALTVARPCPDRLPCDLPPRPLFLRLGPDLAPRLHAPLLLASGEPPAAAWGLRCGPDTCHALASVAASTLDLRLEADSNPTWSAAAYRMDLPDKPGATALRTLWGGPRLAEVAAAPQGAGWMVATITDHPEGSAPPPLPPDADRRAEADKDRAHRQNPRSIPARGAIVSVHPLRNDGTAAPARTLSLRALSSPGVAIAPDAQRQQACVAWVARDNGDPELFLTRVDADGKRVAQQMLTRARGDVTDVALAPVDDGWLVLWVDTRDGNGEVYAARVDASLRRKGPEQRITSAPGDASELTLLVRDHTAVVAFSDSRGAPADGMGDVYVARLKVDDGARIGEEFRVAATPEHARALQLHNYGDFILLTWLEQPPYTDTGGKPGQMQTAFLGADGALRSLPEAVSVGAAGPLSSLSVRCEGEGCQVVVGRPEGRHQWLSVFPWKRGQKEAQAADVTPLFTGAAADTTPVLGPGWVLVGDDSSNQEGRLRRVDLRWP